MQSRIVKGVGLTTKYKTRNVSKADSGTTAVLGYVATTRNSPLIVVDLGWI